MNAVLLTFVILLSLNFVVQIFLEFLNRKNVKANASEIPVAFKEVMDDETYDKSIRYTLTKNRFGILGNIFDSSLLAVIVLCSVVPFLYEWIEGIVGLGAWQQAVTLIAVSMILGLPGIPWELYDTFVIETKFGFNKGTIKLWISDKIKGFIIGLIIGVPILSLIISLVKLPLWWLWAAIIVVVFQIVMMVLYPMFIMPLFNKFEELKEGALRTRLMNLGEKTGFHAKTILVMDGSKRSGHSNAFFTGFGKFRRIVLFDTLVEQLSDEELEAVLAHEIGHYKEGHVPKMLLMSTSLVFVSFALLGWLTLSPWFVEAFGFDFVEGRMAPVLLLFSIMSGLVSFWLTPFTSLRSRKHEYEADDFAKKAMNDDPMPLIRSLRKLSEKNLSNLTPHPTYSAFYYSHPTLTEREAALLKAN